MLDYTFDENLKVNGIKYVCGTDEAGRGPLAGPVVAAACILPLDLEIEGLNDSKKLSEKKREELFDQIIERAGAYGIACAEVEEIEAINILTATYLAMTRAVEQLQVPADFAMIDGNRLPPMLKIPARTIVKGDANSASIAAASILAKVSRDRYMLKMAELYPQYEFAKHKGYGTELHTNLIREYGPSPIHRRSFLINILRDGEFPGK